MLDIGQEVTVLRAMSVIIYKPDIKTFLEEVPESETIYRMSYSRTGGELPTFTLEIALSAFNDQGRPVAWIAEIGNCPSSFDEAVSGLLEKAEIYEAGITKQLEGRKTLEGIVSVEPKKGMLPELPKENEKE